MAKHGFSWLTSAIKKINTKASLHSTEDASKIEEGSKENEKEKEVKKDGETEQQSKKAEAEVNDQPASFLFFFPPFF